MAPRSPRPESPSASRQTKSPSPSGGRGLPSHPGVGGPPRPRPLPRPSPGVGIPPGIPPGTPGHGILGPRRPRRPGRRTLRTRLRTRLGPLRTRLLRRSPETRACHPRDRTRPAHAARVEIVLAPVIPGVPGHHPQTYRREYPASARDTLRASRIASSRRGDAAPPDPPRGVDATPPRAAFRTCLVRLLVRLILRRDAERRRAAGSIIRCRRRRSAVRDRRSRGAQTLKVETRQAEHLQVVREGDERRGRGETRRAAKIRAERRGDGVLRRRPKLTRVAKEPIGVNGSPSDGVSSDGVSARRMTSARSASKRRAGAPGTSTAPAKTTREGPTVCARRTHAGPAGASRARTRGEGVRSTKRRRGRAKTPPKRRWGRDRSRGTARGWTRRGVGGE